VTQGVKRYDGAGHLHYITCSCYQRRPFLGTPARRNLFLKILERVRSRYQFVVVGYVVMPEHFHVLISEPEHRDPSVVMQVVKQEFAKKVLRALRSRTKPLQSRLWAEALEQSHVWQARFCNFDVWSKGKRIEKLRYMHRNPVKRGVVLEPEQWGWSSFRHYAWAKPGPVVVNEPRPAELKIRRPLGKTTVKLSA
jgi:putative transposase